MNSSSSKKLSKRSPRKSPRTNIIGSRSMVNNEKNASLPRPKPVFRKMPSILSNMEEGTYKSSYVPKSSYHILHRSQSMPTYRRGNVSHPLNIRPHEKERNNLQSNNVKTPVSYSSFSEYYSSIAKELQNIERKESENRFRSYFENVASEAREENRELNEEKRAQKEEENRVRYLEMIGQIRQERANERRIAKANKDIRLITQSAVKAQRKKYNSVKSSRKSAKMPKHKSAKMHEHR